MKPSRHYVGVAVLWVAMLSLTACGGAVLEQGADATVTPPIVPPAATASSPTAAVTAALRSSARATTSATAFSISSTTTGSTSRAAPGGSSRSASTGAASTGASPAVASTSSSGQISVAVYFTSGSSLVSEPRSVPAAAPARGSLEALLAGPAVAGHFSQVPHGTRLLSVNLAAGTATVDFSEQIQDIQGSPAIPLFLGQVVNTLTQFPDVQRVMLKANGRTVLSLGGEGAAVPEPLDRAAVQRMLSGA
jgi:germination protein M